MCEKFYTLSERFLTLPFPLTNVVGRFLRIVGYGNSDNDWNSITEVDILGRSL
jgi:hypothetical protein